MDDKLRKATELTWPPLRLQYGLSPLRELAAFETFEQKRQVAGELSGCYGEIELGTRTEAGRLMTGSL